MPELCNHFPDAAEQNSPIRQLPWREPEKGGGGEPWMDVEFEGYCWPIRENDV